MTKLLKEDLKEKIGMAILVENVDGTPIMNGMQRVAAILDFVNTYGRNERGIEAIYGHNLTFSDSDYGITWIAYNYN